MDKLITNVLVIDKDPNTATTFRRIQDEFQVHGTASYSEAMSLAQIYKPQLVVTELNLDHNDGIELIMEMKQERGLPNSLYIVYTSQEDSYTQVIAFNSGADDYILKPISPRLLAGKIKSLKRRLVPQQKSNLLSVGDWAIDTDRFLIHRQNEKIELQKKEFEIINLLSSQPEKVFSRDEIKSRLWGSDQTIKNRTIDVHIRKLRMKIGEDLIQTVKGIGYKI